MDSVASVDVSKDLNFLLVSVAGLSPNETVVEGYTNAEIATKVSNPRALALLIGCISKEDSPQQRRLELSKAIDKWCKDCTKPLSE
jgi:hypothetical protein